VFAQRLHRARGEKASDDESGDNAAGDGTIVLRQCGVRSHRAANSQYHGNNSSKHENLPDSLTGQ
jgi:hypothetical protein